MKKTEEWFDSQDRRDNFDKTDKTSKADKAAKKEKSSKKEAKTDQQKIKALYFLTEMKWRNETVWELY